MYFMLYSYPIIFRLETVELSGKTNRRIRKDESETNRVQSGLSANITMSQWACHAHNMYDSRRRPPTSSSHEMIARIGNTHTHTKSNPFKGSFFRNKFYISRPLKRRKSLLNNSQLAGGGTQVLEYNVEVPALLFPLLHSSDGCSCSLLC